MPVPAILGITRVRGGSCATLGMGSGDTTGGLCMIDHETAGILRLIGLFGLAISVLVWALAERSGHRKTLVSLGTGAALLSALMYLIGVLATADSGAYRFLPRFP